MKNPSAQPPLDLLQWTAYQTPNESQPSAALALTELLKYISNNNLSGISASTALMIAPGYRFRVATGLITNFHQPKSTLLLLVAALIGKRWQTAYQYALDNDFRFLSYGDGCLMLPEQV
jgi:S-adenosylmethionine:tRNA ribosyltransferase-isomerase